MRGDDHLVRLQLLDRVPHGCDGIGLHHDARRGHPLLAQQLERLVQPPPRCRLARVVVDDVALARLVHGRHDGDLHRSAAGVLLDHVDQPPRDDRLVGDDEDMALLRAHGVATSSTSWAGDGARTACCAPGTPYSYGEPTTCGISSKLKIGGGDETCHSSVNPRHGFASATGPNRMLVTML